MGKMLSRFPTLRYITAPIIEVCVPGSINRLFEKLKYILYWGKKGTLNRVVRFCFCCFSGDEEEE